MNAAPVLYRQMTSPETLREFQKDFDIAKEAIGTAQRYLQFEADHAASSAGMKRTFKAAVECGAALKRMHDSESYRDAYDSWDALCRALRIGRQYSYQLIACADKLAKLPPATIGKISAPLSFKQLDTLAEATPEQQEETLDRAAAGDPIAAFAELRDALAAEPEADLEEAEAPRVAKNTGLSWVQRQTTSLRKWFDERGMGEEAGVHLAALMELANGADD